MLVFCWVLHQLFFWDLICFFTSSIFFLSEVVFGVCQIFGRIFDRGAGETNDEILMKVPAGRATTFIQISGATYLGWRAPANST